MQVKCNKCDRIMEAGEVMTHVGIYLASKLEPILERIIRRAIEAYLVSPNRSCFDNVLAALANSIAIECSDCKNKGCWNPYPVIEDIQEEPDPDNITIR